MPVALNPQFDKLMILCTENWTAWTLVTDWLNFIGFVHIFLFTKTHYSYSGHYSPTHLGPIVHYSYTIDGWIPTKKRKNTDRLGFVMSDFLKDFM